MGLPATATLTPSEYLAWEATQTERHELINGEPYAMAGAEDRHVSAYMLVTCSPADRASPQAKREDGLWALHPFEPHEGGWPA